MSFLIVGGLRVTCPSCGSLRQIPRKDGPAPLQIGDEAVCTQTHLQEEAGGAGQDQYILNAWCEDCVAQTPNSRPQCLPQEIDELHEDIEAWDQKFRMAGE